MQRPEAPERAAIDRLYWPVALSLALALLLLWGLGYGPVGSACATAAAAPAERPAPSVARPPATVGSRPSATETPAAPVLAPTPARVYFAVDRDTLPEDANIVLIEVVAYLKADPSARAQIAGFHDASGDPTYNADLAKRRAMKVQGALVAAGIASERIELVKPTVSSPGGPRAEARRVEVSIVTQ